MSLDELLRGQAANDVLAALIRDLTRRVRVDGGSVPEWAQDVCEALAEAAERDPIPLPRNVADSGHALRSIGDTTRWITPGEASDLAGCSERHARRLAATGQVRARRVGARSWQIDADSLTTVLRRTA